MFSNDRGNAFPNFRKDSDKMINFSPKCTATFSVITEGEFLATVLKEKWNYSAVRVVRFICQKPLILKPQKLEKTNE